MSVKKLIFFVANTDWYLFNFRLNLIRACQSAGWQPVLVCPPGPYASRLAELGYRIETLPLGNAGMHPLREMRVLLSLWKLIRREKPALVHLFTLKCVLYGALVSIFAGKPRVIGAVTGMGHLFTTDSLQSRLLKKPFVMALRFALHRSGAHIIFQNEFDRNEFIEKGLIKSSQSNVIRGSGVDCDRFQPPPVSTERLPRLLFASRLIREKGIHEYLEATAQLRSEGEQFESWIAGDRYAGNPSSLKESEVQRLNTHEHHRYLGHCDNMPEVLAQVDIVVLPTYREGTPKILLEAAAMARVVVTTDIPGCQGIVEQGISGYLTTPRSSDALTDVLRKALAKTNVERQTMGLAGREIMQHKFSDAAVTKATFTIYDFVMSGEESSAAHRQKYRGHF